MGHALEDVFQNDGYPFFFVAMVADGDSTAYERIVNDYNYEGYPTGWWDGGYNILLGGYPELEKYRTRTESTGARDVPGLEFSIDLTWLGGSDIQIDLTLINKSYTPLPPEGDSTGCIGLDYEFTASAVEPDGNQLYYRFDFGDETIPDWMGPFDSNDTCTAANVWDSTGEYTVKVQTRNENNMRSNWSEEIQIKIYDYVSGDVNGNLVVNILDITYIISFLYLGGPAPDPYANGDVNGNIVVNLLDITYLITYLYLDGPAPIYYED